MKTLYLHIGMARCGTTSIQNFCVNNQEELNRNGYCYPLMPFHYSSAHPYRNAHFMVGRLHNNDQTRNYKTEQQWREEGFAHLYNTFQSYDNVILSDEGLWNCGFRDDNNIWKRLREEMLEHHFQTKVIVYLRRQDEYLSSWWGQRIKEARFAQKTITWEEMLHTMPIVKLDYYQMLESIALYVGQENIIVRRFGKQYFINNCLYQDFLTAINLELTASYHIEREIRNQGLSANNIEIKRILNHIPDITPSEEQDLRNILIQNSNMLHSQTNYNMFSKEEALTFYNRYKEQNQKVAKKYLGIDDNLFEFQYRGDKKWNPNNREMLSDILLFMTQEMLILRRELDSANAQIKKQQNQLNYTLGLLQHPFKAVGNKLKKTGKQ